MNDDINEREITPEELQEAMEEFGLHDGYTHADIMASYHRLTRKYHPDLATDEYDKAKRKLVMKRVNSEYQALLASLSRNIDMGNVRMPSSRDIAAAVYGMHGQATSDAHDTKTYGTSSNQQGSKASEGEQSDKTIDDGVQSCDNGANTSANDIGFIERLHMTARRWKEGDVRTNTFVTVVIAMNAIEFIVGLILSIGRLNVVIGDALIVLSALNFFTNSIGVLLTLKLLGYMLSFIATVLDGVAFISGRARKSCDN